MTLHGSPLPTRIRGRLSVNLAPSLEQRMEGLIGFRSPAEQANCSPVFRLSTLITEPPSAPSEQSSEPQMEATPGQVRRVEQAMIYRESRARMPTAEQRSVLAARS